MKQKVFTSVFLVIVLHLLCISQDSSMFWYQGMYNPDANFYTIQSQAQNHFNSLEEIDTAEGGGKNIFKRWEYFWQDRVYKSGDSIAGSFKYTDIALDNFLDNKDTYFPQNPVFNIPWQYIGRDSATQLCMGIVISLAIDTSSQSTNIVYAGTNASGLWKSTDDGENWSNISDAIGAPGIGVTDIVLDPTDSDVIYISTGVYTYGRGYGMGIWKTSDGGSSWVQIWDEGNSSTIVEKLVMDPNDPDNLYALVLDKVFRTLDGGQTWELIFNELYQPYTWNKRRLLDICFKPGSSDTLYFASEGSCTVDTCYTSEIWRTYDIRSSNVQWVRVDDTLSGDYARRLSISPTMVNPSFIYCGYTESNGNYKLKKSRDNGNNWITLIDTNVFFGGVDEWMNELVVSPTDTSVCYVGGLLITKVVGNNLYKSGTDLSADFHVDVRELILINGSISGTGGVNDVIYVGNDGGVSKSDNGAQSWDGINGKGLRITQYYGLGISDIIPELYAGGTQDNGIITHNPNWDNPWKNYTKSDNYETIINYSDPNYIYSLSYGGAPGIHYSYNMGKKYGTRPYPQNEPVMANWPLLLDKNLSAKLITGLRDVYSMNNIYDVSWTRISEFVASPFYVDSNAKISDVDVYRRNENIMYVSYGNPISWNGELENKLFKTIDGGETWEDISTNLLFLEDNQGITDIEIHPSNPNIVWLTLGGFSSPGTTKVIKTTNSFASYSDYSEGLPDFPVSCVKSNMGSVFELFLCNDVGVFYRNDTMDQWVSYGGGLPICIVSDLEIDSKNNKIKISTFGRGLWEIDGTNPCGSSTNDTIFITSDTTWDSYLRIHKTVFITNGATLTIQGIIHFGSNNKIIVDRGAELIIDGGELKSSCDGIFWQGIDVWGTKHKSQYQTQYQGKLSLKNNAIIKNAYKAISTVKRGPIFYDLDYTGGIVFADSSFFNGNYIDLDFYKYKNYLPEDSINKNEISNLSYFNECGFGGKITFDTLKPMHFVKLFKVNGVKFSKCKFISNVEHQDTSDYYNSIIYLLRAKNIQFEGCHIRNDSFYLPGSINYNRGIGIYSFNSTFSISPFYSSEDTSYSSISKFTYGVKALTSNPENNFRIDSCIFYNNSRGIYCSGISFASMRSNTFNLPIGYYSWDYPYYGIYLDNCTKYHIENNILEFQNYPGSVFNSVGIICNNSGDDLNMIYRNYFNKLSYGIIAQNNNRGTDRFSGLKIKCNDFFACSQDIAVTSDIVDGYGISRYQGYNDSPDAPAGNIFSHYYVDYDNELDNIVYFHHDTIAGPDRIVPKDYTQNTISLYNVNGYAYGSNSCPPTTNKESQDSLKSTMSFHESQIELTQIELDTWVDGGSTQELVSEVEYSTPPEGYDLSTELLLESPYLSDSVMIEAINKENVLTPLMVTDILVANPQSAKSKTIDQELDQRSIPLSTDMRDNINQGIFELSSLELLESKMSYFKQKKTLARNKLVQNYLNDYYNLDARDSLYSLCLEDDLSMQYFLSFLKLEDLGINAANNTLSIVANSLTVEQLDIHQLYLDYINILGSLDSAGKELHDLSIAQKTELYELLNYNYGPSALARNTLIHADTLSYEEPIIFPSVYKSEEILVANNNNDKTIIELSLFPNPAQNYITIAFNLSQIDHGSYLQICYINGAIIDKINLPSSKNHIFIGLQDYPNGSYICNLVINGETVSSKKFIVIK